MDRESEVERAAAEALAKAGSPAVQWLAAALEGDMRDGHPLRILEGSPSRDPDAVLRAQHRAMEVLRQIDDVRAVEPLIKQLGNRDLAMAAASALGDRGDLRAVEPLIAALGYEGYIPEAAAGALGKLGDRRAVGPLIDALLDPDHALRAKARESLDRIDRNWKEAARTALHAMIEALRHPQKNARLAAAEALELLDWQPTDNSQRAWFAVARLRWDEAAHLGDSAFEALLAVHHDEYSDVRAGVAKALGDIGDPRAVDVLGEMLKDRSVSTAAADALAKLENGASAAVACLIAALQECPPERMQRIAQALIRIGESSMETSAAIPALIAALEQEPSGAMDRIVWALVRIGKPAVEPLWGVFESGKYAQACFALKAIKLIGDECMAQRLIGALSDNKSLSVRKLAAETLQSCGWHPADEAERALEAVALQDWEEAAALGSAAVPALVSALDAADSDGAARVLGRLKDPRAVAPLTAAVSRRSETAAWALIAMEDMSVLGPVTKYLNAPMDYRGAQLLSNALWLLLEKHAEKASLKDLRLVAQLTSVSGPEYWDPYEECRCRDSADYFPLAKLAREELRRRGDRPDA